jgi:hypothetical protein
VWVTRVGDVAGDAGSLGSHREKSRVFGVRIRDPAKPEVPTRIVGKSNSHVYIGVSAHHKSGVGKLRTWHRE